MIKFYGYKKCSTCRKAENFLTKNKVEFEFIDIVDSPPSQTLLKKIFNLSAKPIKKFFNTSGQVYREMDLKNRVDKLTEKEALRLMADNGKLIKRPLAFDEKHAVVGFKEEEYTEYWT